MALTNAKKRQIVKDLGIRCPVRRWQQHKDGSVTVYTRAGSQTWEPQPPPEPKPEPKPTPNSRTKESKPKAEKSGDTEA